MTLARLRVLTTPQNGKADQYWETLMRNADPDRALDEVIGLWRQAEGHEDEADMLEGEAKNERGMANELYARAEAIWQPLLVDHPEWRDDLVSGEDPRA